MKSLEENILEEWIKNILTIPSYPVEIRGLENLNLNKNYIFACNHSNTHDLQTAKRFIPNKTRVFAASDCLNPITTFGFKIMDSILFDRNNKEERLIALQKLINSLVEGYNIAIFPEATWNLSNNNPMMPLKWGCVKASYLTGVPIVPTIFEYVENDKIESKETDIYKKLIISFGNPLYITNEEEIATCTFYLRDVMAKERLNIWKEVYGYPCKLMSDEVYKNHLELKTNTSLYKHNIEKESTFILKKIPLNYKESQK